MMNNNSVESSTAFAAPAAADFTPLAHLSPALSQISSFLGFTERMNLFTIFQGKQDLQTLLVDTNVETFTISSVADVLNPHALTLLYPNVSSLALTLPGALLMRLVEQGRFLPLLGSAANSFRCLERIVTPNLSVQDRKNLFVASSSDQHQRLRDLLVDETCHDLMIESTEQMGDPGVWVSLYPNIRTISFDGTLDNTLPQGTETFLDVLIPFVASFRRLDRIVIHDTVKILLVLSLQVPRVEGEGFVLQEAARPLQRLVETLCDAYASGSLPHTVRVLASTPPDHEEASLLFCPNPHATEMGCPLCRRVAKHSPSIMYLH